VDEFDAGEIHIGALTHVRAEGESKEWDGLVVEISDRVSRKHLVPNDPSRPTDTGIVAVEIASPARLPFKLGQKVTVKIERNVQATGPTIPKLLSTRGCGNLVQD
jgi:hypothetical protein